MITISYDSIMLAGDCRIE